MSSEIQAILNSAGRYPLLTAEQELIHGRQIIAWLEIQDLDPETLTPQQRRIVRNGKRAYERMFTCNLRLVISVAKKYAVACRHLGLEDLVQEGCIGLASAIRKFDPARGYKFSTYSYWWIRQSIMRGINRYDRVIRLPGPALDAWFKLGRYVPEYRRIHGKTPSLEECIEQLNIQQVETLRSYLNHFGGTCSLDAQLHAKDDGEVGTLVDMIPCDRESPWDAVETEERLQIVDELVKKLTPKQRHIINCRWGLSGEIPRQLHEMPEIGNRHSVRYQQAMGIRALRATMGVAA